MQIMWRLAGKKKLPPFYVYTLPLSLSLSLSLPSPTLCLMSSYSIRKCSSTPTSIMSTETIILSYVIIRLHLSHPFTLHCVAGRTFNLGSDYIVKFPSFDFLCQPAITSMYVYTWMYMYMYMYKLGCIAFRKFAVYVYVQTYTCTCTCA